MIIDRIIGIPVSCDLMAYEEAWLALNKDNRTPAQHT
jgi:hypothetical protein